MKNARATDSKYRQFLSGSYFLFFTILGIFVPYFNLHCYHLKFSPLEIGLLSGTLTAMKMISPFLWSWKADQKKSRKKILFITTFGSAAAFLPCIWIQDFLPMLIAIFFYSFFFMGILPLIEAAALETVELRGGEYGKIRLWGSLGFIFASLGCGYLIDLLSTPIALYLTGVFSFLLLVPTARIPETDHRKPEGEPDSADLSVLNRPEIGIFFLLCVIMQITHGTYYGFFAIFMESIGFTKSTVGICWTFAVLCEIAVMFRYQKWFGKNRPQTWLALCFLIAAFRWWLTAKADSLMLFLFAQCLHAFTYGAFHIASLTYLNRHVPANFRTSAIGLLSSLSYGLGGTIGAVFSGIFYDSLGARVLFVFSGGFSLIGAALALWLWSFPSRRENGEGNPDQTVTGLAAEA
ncbi:MAG TPA: major facilitator superfamily domain-containing protein 6 [Candidatus Omnitrophota bacterium]|nr:major facilitator superfamily domain-containing protein 6 [Candidatus Omnitrophota bacterium]